MKITSTDHRNYTQIHGLLAQLKRSRAAVFSLGFLSRLARRTKRKKDTRSVGYPDSQASEVVRPRTEYLSDGRGREG